jgi:hypothetical protein
MFYQLCYMQGGGEGGTYKVGGVSCRGQDSSPVGRSIHGALVALEWLDLTDVLGHQPEQRCRRCKHLRQTGNSVNTQCTFSARSVNIKPSGLIAVPLL